MARPIPTMDLTFLLAETRDCPQHVAGLLIFENPGADAGWCLVDLVNHYRASKPIAPFNAIPEFRRLGRPSWVRVAEPDMHYHVQHLALPAPGSDAQLAELVQQWHSEQIDRNRPLFQMLVIEGLSGGRFALMLKMHHAIIDGASGIMRLIASLSPDPKAGLGAPMYAVDMGIKRRQAPTGLVARLGGTSGNVMTQAKALLQLTSGLWRKTVARIIAGQEASGSLPFEAPTTAINIPIRHGRAFSHLSLPLAPFRAAAKLAGGTINDAVLAVVDTAMEAYLRERNASPSRPLVALVPVSLREPGDKEASTKISAVVAPLGDADADFGTRILQIVERLNSAKGEVRALSKPAAANYAVGMYAVAEGLGTVGIQLPLANFVVSNVPGSAEQLYLGGSRLVGVHAASVLAAGMGLNVTLVSNAGHLDFGFTAHKQALPDPQRVAAHCAAAFEMMQAWTASHAPGKGSDRAKPAAAVAKKRAVSEAKDKSAAPRTAVKRSRARKVA